MRIGYLQLDGWSGRQRPLVWIVRETATRFWVRLLPNATDAITLPGRSHRRLIWAVPQQVPKSAVKIVGLGAVLAED